MAPTGSSKARLDIEDGQSIDCLFNPKDYTVTKANAYEAKAKPGTTAGQPQFGGGSPMEMTLQLLFDASLMQKGQTVVDATTALFKMMEASHAPTTAKGKNRPPMITFVWGSVISFKAFAKSLTVQYQLFAADGTPIRADVKLSLLQADAAPLAPQNPTTRSDGSLGTHVVREGDTLAAIAYRTYGDPNNWRAVAEANGVDDPMRLRRGAALALPRIDA